MIAAGSRKFQPGNSCRVAILIILSLCFTANLYATNPRLSGQIQADYDEVFLAFRYQAGVNTIVMGLYFEDAFYLPVMELFNALQIPYSHNQASLTVSGIYLDPNTRYSINSLNREVRVGSRTYSFTSDDIIVGEIDYYFRPEQFSEWFGLDFEIDFSGLILKLQTSEKMPVVETFERARRRSMIEDYMISEPQYPIRFGRDRKMLNGGFLDYGLSATQSNAAANLISYNLSGGIEVVGGDFQGSLTGIHSEIGTRFNYSGIRWRYVWLEQPWLTQFQAGQIQSTGLQPQNMRGVSLTNEPIQPRILFQEYVIDDVTVPEAEVELYLNDRLIDFQRSDEFGRYRFAVPLTYGSTDLKIIIYSQTGERIETSQRLQIPFSFLPKGTLNYQIYAGELDFALLEADENQNNVFQSNVAYGVTDWLTVKSGVDYYEGYKGNEPIPYIAASGRLFDEYLLNIDAAPSALYRFNGSVFYANNRNFTATFTEYTSDGILNRSRLERDWSLSAFSPFRIGTTFFSARLAYDQLYYDNGFSTRINSSLNTRLRRANIRMNYRRALTSRSFTRDQINDLLSLLATYTIARSPSLPVYIRGSFLRAQLDYRVQSEEFERFDFQLSRSMFRAGRLQVGYSRNFIAMTHNIQIGFTYDFNYSRTSTTVRTQQSNYVISQNIRGSVGYDSRYNQFVLDSRQQVGRAATAFRLFVDNNNNGTFDEGDVIMPDNAVRIRRAGTTHTSRDEITRHSQLLAYNRYDVDIIKANISDPFLVPRVENFSIVTDPNQYKAIDIALQITGFIDGQVQRETAGGLSGVGGLRLYLEDTKTGIRSEIRTFSDGSFYQMEVRPGDYEVYVDSTQLEFLNVYVSPASYKFSIESMPGGDFIEGLNFLLTAVPVMQPEIPEPPPVIPQPVVSVEFFRIQTAVLPTLARAVLAKLEAEEMTGVPYEIQYSESKRTFRVFSQEIEGMPETLGVLENLRSTTQFKDAFVIDENHFETQDLNYAVQLGAFRVEENARRLMAEAREVYGLETVLIVDPVPGLHVVMLPQSDNWLDANLLRNFIRQETRYVDAFVRTMPYVTRSDYEFIVQVAAFTDMERAYALADVLTREHGIRNFIYLHPKTGYYTIRIRAERSMEEAFHIRQRLIDLGYEPPIILTLRK